MVAEGRARVYCKHEATILKRDLVEIGQVRKCHGYAGEVKLLVFEGHEEDVEDVEFIFIGSSPKTALPYEVLNLRGADWICTLEGVTSKEAAAKLRGMALYLNRSEVSETPVLRAAAESEKFRQFLGFALIDTEKGEIGQVVDLVDNPLQTLAKVMHNGEEVLVPLVQDFIHGIDFVKKIIFVDLPEGLLEL